MNTNTTNTTGTEFFDELLTSSSGAYPDNRFPMFHLDENGDCLEVVLSAEAFNGERVDSRVTIYRGIECNKMVGVLVKGLLESSNPNERLKGKLESVKSSD